WRSRRERGERWGVVLRTGWSACPAATRLCAMSKVPAPDVDGGRFRFPDAGMDDARQRRQRPIFRAEADPLVGLGHHGGLAGDRGAQHGKAIARRDGKSREAIQLFEAVVQRRLEAVALAPTPGEIGSSHFAVVLGLEVLALVRQEEAQPVVV